MKDLQKLHGLLPVWLRIVFMITFLGIITAVMVTRPAHDAMLWLSRHLPFDGMVLISFIIIIISTKQYYSLGTKKKVTAIKVGMFCVGLTVLFCSKYSLPNQESYYKELANRNSYAEKEEATNGEKISLNDFKKSQASIKKNTVGLPYWRDSPLPYESLRTYMLFRDYFTSISISETVYWEGELYTKTSSALIGYRGIEVSTPYIKGYAYAYKGDVEYTNESKVLQGLPSIPLEYAIEVCRAQAWQLLKQDKRDKIQEIFLVKTKDAVLWVIIFPDLRFEFDSRKGTVDYILGKKLSHNERKRRVNAM